MKPTDKSGPSGQGSATDEREPYESPKLDSEELFEVLAITCGKIKPNRFSCIRVPRLS